MREMAGAPICRHSAAAHQGRDGIHWLQNRDALTVALIAASAVSLVVSLMGWSRGLPFDAAWVAVLLCGAPIMKNALEGLVRTFDIRSDLLVSTAIVASIVIGQVFAAGEIAAIMAVGSLLEERTARKAREGIERLVVLSPQTVRVIRDGGASVVGMDEVEVGDTVRVLPGETVPVDGAIVSGHTSIDQSVMTGESLPVDKGVGSEVFSGTANQFGAFDMRVTRVGKDSSLQRIIALMESADANRAPIVRTADRMATWVVAIAFASALVAWAVTGDAVRGVTVLVVFCPCALVLATPTAIMAGIGNASRHGLLVRNGDALERLSEVNCVAFDKTGTLTRGNLEVVAVTSLSPSITDEQLLRAAASAESLSEHPLGRAILEHARSAGLDVGAPEAFEMLPGRGVKASVNCRTVLAGNAELLRASGVELPDRASASATEHRHSGRTVIFIAVDDEPVGIIALSDTVRKDARGAIESLRSDGLGSVLITGDSRQAALSIAQQVGVTEVRFEQLPEGKMSVIDQYQRAGDSKVCMVGDGINDAPALRTAFASIAMGGIGSDMAIDSADVVLISEDLHRIPYLFRLARRTVRTIKMNIFLAMSLNFAAILLAAFGIIGPVMGALLHNVGSVAVVLSSAAIIGLRRGAP